MKLGGLWREEGFITIILKDSTGKVLDVIQAKTPGYSESPEITVHVKPGSTALVAVPISVLNNSVVSVFEPAYGVYQVLYHGLIPENYYGPGFEINAIRVNISSSYVEVNETFELATYGALGDSIIILEFKIREDAKPGVYVAYVSVPWASLEPQTAYNFVVNVFVTNDEGRN